MIIRCKNSMTQPIRAAVAPSDRNISPYEKPSIAHCLLEVLKKIPSPSPCVWIENISN